MRVVSCLRGVFFFQGERGRQTEREEEERTRKYHCRISSLELISKLNSLAILVVITVSLTSLDLKYLCIELIFRSADEVKIWNKKEHPIARFRTYLIDKGWWKEGEEIEWQKNVSFAFK